ncbi:biotin transporter BioY [Sinorhizobium numidicum]|uniref:Biotin transporter BioY n=1 Tax=Sinorhizobium numidicum TaxID=680248 RepID=A0ABY8D358_9HYPH|nr:biotin transporter BioY [Sinorhizobium numidicum]WEX77878.1 biotin transporter BioY [Sinorhizobium numidicum]WEX84537.1 biotin transporter BioY [Sinorhizobium numidicum]
MSGLETAIRNALERSDRSNAEVRARIYQSARQALENGLQKQQIEDPDVIARQRHRLEAVIHAIETEERAALKARAAAAPVAGGGVANGKAAATEGSSAGAAASAAARREPEFSATRRRPVEGDSGLAALRPDRDGPMVSTRPAADSGKAAEAGKPGQIAPDLGVTDKRPRKRRRGRFLSFVMVVATLAAAAGAAVWWVQTNDLLKSPAERDTNVANPPATVETEDFDGATGLQNLAAQEGFSGDWIEIFTAADAAAVKPGARAKAEPVDDGGGRRVRITSAVPTEDGDVAVEIPAEFLAQLSGKSSTLALTVQAMPGKTTEFSVECDFSTLGDCGRHRFTAHDERLDMLFKVTFEQSSAPNSPGRLVINSDLGGAGNSLNIFAVRMLPGE